MPPTTIDLTKSSWFGAGGAEPYDHALLDPNRVLYLRDVELGSAVSGFDQPIDVARFIGRADDGDLAALSSLCGPVLDVGCGPGRIVRAAILAGHLALGVDVSVTAVSLAQQEGLPVLHRSVFQDLPSEGTWGSVLLLDGNIGIGGDAAALLDRCIELVLDQGRGQVIVEAHPIPHRDHRFEAVAVDDLGRHSTHFPWAEVGVSALLEYADRSRLTLQRQWTHGARTFVEFASP